MIDIRNIVLTDIIGNYMAEPYNIMGGNSGVYFLCKDYEIQYIGKSSDIKKRVQSHTNKIEFNTVFYVHETDRIKYSIIEKKLISFFKPKINKASINCTNFEYKENLDFDENNLTFRLKAPRFLVKKVLDKMKVSSVRKRSEIMYTLLDQWSTKND